VLTTDKAAGVASMSSWYRITDPAKLEGSMRGARQPRKPIRSIAGGSAHAVAFKPERGLTSRKRRTHRPRACRRPTSGYIDGL